MPKGGAIPVFDYRSGKNGVLISNTKLQGKYKAKVDGQGGLKTLSKTPVMGDYGLHGGVLIKDNDRPKIIYH